MNNNEISTQSIQETVENKEKRIDLNTLLFEYNRRSSTELKVKYIKSKIKITPYVDYGVKMYLASQVIEQSCLKNEKLHMDSCKKYILYIFSLLYYWTNLNVEERNFLHQYDQLESSGILDILLTEMIPETEQSTFRTILEMKEHDLLTNNYSTESLIERIAKGFSPILKGMDEYVGNLDDTRVVKIFERILKVIK